MARRPLHTFFIAFAVLAAAGCGREVRVTISPDSTTVQVNASVEFAATVTGASDTSVTWSIHEGAAGGTIDAQGRYTAPAQPGAYHVIATSVADARKRATATITVEPGSGVMVEITPGNATVGVGGFQSFTAKVSGTENPAVTWTVAEDDAGGTITPGGTYTAPSTPGTYHVVATSVSDPSKSGRATVTVTDQQMVSIAVVPDLVTVPGGESVLFAAQVQGTENTAVYWSIAEGTAGGVITSGGVYTAPLSKGVFHVVATSQADLNKTATATVTVVPDVRVTITPASVTLGVGATQKFIADVTGSNDQTVTWSIQEGAAGGSIDSSGSYTAPSSPGTFHVIATSVADPTRSATATVTVEPITVTVEPASASLEVNTSMSFVATVVHASNADVTWSVQEGSAGGSVQSTDGDRCRYTAPATPGTYHLVATSVADASASKVVEITVLPPPVVVTVKPGFLELTPNATHTFQATVTGASNPAVTWSVQGGGTITQSGQLTAPATSGDLAVIATSVEDPSKSGTAYVSVLPTGGHTLSGTVAYAGSRTGRIFINVATSTYGEATYGTSIAGPGAFTIRGIRANGTVHVRAYMDTLGIAAYNKAGDPTVVTTVDLPTTGPVTLTLAEPTTVTPPSPTLESVDGGDGMALVSWRRVADNNRSEIADHYKVYWSTSANPGPGTPNTYSRIFRAGNTLATIRDTSGAPLTNGSVYYFTVTAVNNGVESPPSQAVSAAIGPIGGGASVSGTVSFSGFTPTGPLYVMLYGNAGTFLAKVENPVSPQTYSVSGVSPGGYYLYAWIDSDDDGELFGTDVSNFDDPEVVSVSAAGLSGKNLTFASGNANAKTTTSHTMTNGSDYWQISHRIDPNAKQPVAVALISGPNGELPVDLALARGFGFTTTLFLGPTVPTTGVDYSFEVTYSDGSTATLTSQALAAIEGFATPLTPSSTSNQNPVFTWSAPSPAPALQPYVYNLYLYRSNGGYQWFDQEIPSSTTSVDYNENGWAAQSVLSMGQSYLWYMEVVDAHGNSSLFVTGFKVQ